MTAQLPTFRPQPSTRPIRVADIRHLHRLLLISVTINGVQFVLSLLALQGLTRLLLR